ncbi:L-glutamate ABC transporter membrane protein /L-aspartate ABC transporter membrane protein [Variovorax sp. CF079]|uniref:amino acid ABC transporter permease n=1 Tax=Variovorax sp. CF079 TaxID=1882774 RepID=UPI000887255D|nr:amino acid ABC transporter permease [Variovorax sp. CF079]SDE93622.1 L-glutamate ABC transporter membrane protein /L-aspartate ABC transporter membrane protein [Variovorax sp. CF079]
MDYDWRWSVFLQPTLSGAMNYAELLLRGAWMTVSTAVLAWGIALGLGTIIGVLRTVPNRALGAIARAYVEIFRNIPLLLQLFLWYFVLPELLPERAGNWLKTLSYASFCVAFIGLGFYTASRVAEQIRAGIQAQARGQTNAALALGMTLPQVYRHVLVPRAYVTMLPTLTSEGLAIMKNTSVALTIGLAELTAQARAMQEYTFQVFEAFTAATLMYFALNVVVVQFSRLIERRTAHRA